LEIKKMSNSINSVVVVNITRETTTVSQAGFGTGNFLSNDARFTDRIKKYADLDEVTSDTLRGADTLAFATKYFGQTIKPEALYVTKKMNDVVALYDITFSADFVASNVIDMSINAVTIADTTYATSHAATLAALAVNIAAHADVDTATVTGARTIRVAGLTAGLAIAITAITVTGGASQATGSLALVAAPDTVGTDVASITAARDVLDDWYMQAAYTRTEANILLIAAYIQATTKLYAAVSEDSDVKTSSTTDIASDLNAAGYDRTFILYSTDSENYPEAAWMGFCLPLTPGEETWKFKTLKGITFDALTGGEQTYIKNKKANFYNQVGGVSITQDGTVASGEYIDVMRGVDWIQARIQEEVYTVLVNSKKVPYTNNGVNTVTTAIRKVLKRAVTNGVLADDPQFTITAPLVADISVTDKGNRLLPDIKFTGTLAGAIHKINISGTVSL
jgi:hypothetical protein